jgi:erythromycin esterase-like protein
VKASHGTHEFYSTRAEITRRLIREKGFQAVAVEADWPDAYLVNRYVRGRSEDTRAAQALSGFTRFPVWMWRNRDVEAFSVTLKGDDRLATEFSTERLERAIGVIYRPETERISHYFMARLADQFDAVLHFDETSAVELLPHSEEDERQMSELPETYPTGV